MSKEVNPIDCGDVLAPDVSALYCALAVEGVPRFTIVRGETLGDQQTIQRLLKEESTDDAGRKRRITEIWNLIKERDAILPSGREITAEEKAGLDAQIAVLKADNYKIRPATEAEALAWQPILNSSPPRSTPDELQSDDPMEWARRLSLMIEWHGHVSGQLNVDWLAQGARKITSIGHDGRPSQWERENRLGDELRRERNLAVARRKALRERMAGLIKRLGPVMRKARIDTDPLDKLAIGWMDYDVYYSGPKELDAQLRLRDLMEKLADQALDYKGGLTFSYIRNKWHLTDAQLHRPIKKEKIGIS